MVYRQYPAAYWTGILLNMLEFEDSVKPEFINPLTGQQKLIECIRVDGYTDEGVLHLEVQFWWTLRHFQKPTFVTLVTARNSGASFLNQVELQNGCLSQAPLKKCICVSAQGAPFTLVI